MQRIVIILLLSVLKFVPLFAVAQKQITLSYRGDRGDYSQDIQNALDLLVQSGGGTLNVPFGKYQVKKRLFVLAELKRMKISIKGIPNSKRQNPLFYDTDVNALPHAFLAFQGNISKPILSFSIENIDLLGNNPVYTANHPFINKDIFSRGIEAFNVETGTIKNCIITNVYGGGIAFTQGHAYSGRQHRIHNPQVLNCQVINSWGWRGQDDMGDGVFFWQCDRPVVKDCIIRNDLFTTKQLGRCGIVLEHNSENGLVTGNIVEGYDRGLHAECDYGGHIIERNTFGMSKNGITLSYDCQQDVRYKKDFSPITIRNNTFRYNNELEKNRIVRNDWGYISIHRPSFVLDGLKIINNRFITNNSTQRSPMISTPDKKMMGTSKKNYLRLMGQQKVTISNNTYF